MRTSNVAIVKNCFAQKEDCDIIVELRSAKENLKTQPADPKPLEKPESIIETSTYK